MILENNKETYIASKEFLKQLEDTNFKNIVKELVDFGLYRNKKYYGKPYKSTSLQLYNKYSYEDVCRLLEWEKNVVSLNIGGYKYDEKSKTYPVFINYHKENTINDSIKYEDRFETSSRLVAISKSKRTPESNDVKTAYNAEKLGVSMELFVRKNKEDKGSKEFYYLGRMNTAGEPKPIKMNGSGLNAVEIVYGLETGVREDIFEYICEG